MAILVIRHLGSGEQSNDNLPHSVTYDQEASSPCHIWLDRDNNPAAPTDAFDTDASASLGEYNIGSASWDLFGPDGLSIAMAGTGTVADPRVFTPNIPGRWLVRVTAEPYIADPSGPGTIAGPEETFTVLLEIQDPAILGADNAEYPSEAPSRATSMSAANETVEFDADEGWSRGLERYLNTVSKGLGARKIASGVNMEGGQVDLGQTVTLHADALDTWKNATASAEDYQNFVVQFKLIGDGDASVTTGPIFLALHDQIADGDRSYLLVEGLIPVDTTTLNGGGAASMGDLVYVGVGNALTTDAGPLANKRIVGVVASTGTDTDTNPGSIWFHGSTHIAGVVHSSGDSTDEHLVRWDGNNTHIVQDSLVRLSQAAGSRVGFSTPGGEDIHFYPGTVSSAEGVVLTDDGAGNLEASFGAGSPSAGKVATFHGDVDITGNLDPTGVIFTETTAGNVPTGANEGAIFVSSADNNLYYIPASSGAPVLIGGGTGDVVGPASSVNDSLARFDGTTGKLIQDTGSNARCTNTGNMTIVGLRTNTLRVGIGTPTTPGYVLTAGTVNGDGVWAAPSIGAETDPIFTASDSFGITTADITNWDNAFGWGDHGAAGYLTAVVDDATPFLGGNLVVNGHDITSSGSGFIRIKTPTAANTGALFFSTGSSNAAGDSGEVLINTGNSITSGDSGELVIKTGNASGGDSGGVTIETGTASGTRGDISLDTGALGTVEVSGRLTAANTIQSDTAFKLTNTAGTIGHVLTSIDVSGTAQWAAPAGGSTPSWSSTLSVDAATNGQSPLIEFGDVLSFERVGGGGPTESATITGWTSPTAPNKGITIDGDVRINAYDDLYFGTDVSASIPHTLFENNAASAASAFKIQTSDSDPLVTITTRTPNFEVTTGDTLVDGGGGNQTKSGDIALETGQTDATGGQAAGNTGSITLTTGRASASSGGTGGSRSGDITLQTGMADDGSGGSIVLATHWANTTTRGVIHADTAGFVGPSRASGTAAINAQSGHPTVPALYIVEFDAYSMDAVNPTTMIYTWVPQDTIQIYDVMVWNIDSNTQQPLHAATPVGTAGHGIDIQLFNMSIGGHVINSSILRPMSPYNGTAPSGWPAGMDLSPHGVLMKGSQVRASANNLTDDNYALNTHHRCRGIEFAHGLIGAGNPVDIVLSTGPFVAASLGGPYQVFIYAYVRGHGSLP